MSTIKDVATLAGVSLSTVSIILNGKSKERKISDDTQKKVWDAVKEVNYHPNISARRLRENESNEHIIVALYWASDFRASMLARFLKGLEMAVDSLDKIPEIVIFPYKNNKLCDERAFVNGNRFNAVIVANTSEKDMKFLETIEPTMPVVLYNRSSKKYCTVTVDNYKMGALAAAHFDEMGHKEAMIVTSTEVFPGMRIREKGFIETCKKLGIVVSDHKIVTQKNSISAGAEGANSLIGLNPLPTAIFCASDALAYGTCYTLKKNNIDIPKDVAIISIGNGDSERSIYHIPSLTVVHLPMEDMAQKCMEMVIDLLENRVETVYSTLLDTPIIVRDSTKLN